MKMYILINNDKSFIVKSYQNFLKPYIINLCSLVLKYIHKKYK